MKKFKKIAALILSLAMVLALVACGGGSSSKPASTPDSSKPASTPDASTPADSDPVDTNLIVGVMDDTDGFDPINTVNFVGCNLVYEGLFDIDPETSEIVGVLAESWSYDDDTHLRVKLYDNATFSNGESVTGEDVYWSWYRNISENGKEASSFAFVDWDNWEFVSDKEFVISYAEAFGPAVNYMTMSAFSVIDKSAMENATSDDYWSAPVGSGPYTVKENVSGAYSSYVRNENYWNAATMPEATSITVKNYSDAAAMFIDFETGAIDMAFGLDETDAKRINDGSVANAQLVTISTNNVIGLALPEYTASLDDVRVRQALAYAMDVNALTEIGYGILGQVATTMIPGNIQYSLETGVQEYNPEKAKQLLADAGVSGLTLEMVIVGAPTNERLATAMQAYLAAVGVDLQIISCDLATAISHFKASETDVVLNSGANVTMDTFESLQMTLETSSNATIRITDPAYNAGVMEAKLSSDNAVREKGYTAAQQWLAENYRQIPICEPLFAFCFNTEKVAGLSTMCDEALSLRYVTFVG